MSEARHFETASEFCSLVRTAHLLEYLGISEDVTPEAGLSKLKKRRKYMQGMQSNPKYKDEALFLIKHFSQLQAALEDIPAYLVDVGQRKELTQIPVLEMAIRGVLAGGSLTEEQVSFLQRNALDLGVREATFTDVLERLKAESGISESAKPNHKTEEAADASDASTPSRAPEAPPNIEDAYRSLDTQDATEANQPLSHQATAPPARQRNAFPSEANTAPPVRPRHAGLRSSPPRPSDRPDQPPQFQILSEPTQHVTVGRKAIVREVVVRNLGTEPIRGTVSTDQPWLVAKPRKLDPSAQEQVVTVHIRPSKMQTNKESGAIYIQCQNGQKQTINFEVKQRTYLPILLAVAGILLLLTLIGGLLITSSARSPATSPPGLTVLVDPGSQEVLLGNQRIGRGREAYLASPPRGSHLLQISHPNFETYSQKLIFEDDAPRTIRVTLDLKSPLDFVPTQDARKATLDPAAAQRVLGPISPSLDACVRSNLQPGQKMFGSVRIHIGRTGTVIGIEVRGDAQRAPSIADCLRRNAAAALFEPLEDGEYATVRYDYRVTEASPGR